MKRFLAIIFLLTTAVLILGTKVVEEKPTPIENTTLDVLQESYMARLVEQTPLPEDESAMHVLEVIHKAWKFCRQDDPTGLPDVGGLVKNEYLAISDDLTQSWIFTIEYEDDKIAKIRAVKHREIEYNVDTGQFKILRLR